MTKLSWSLEYIHAFIKDNCFKALWMSLEALVARYYGHHMKENNLLDFRLQFSNLD